MSGLTEPSISKSLVISRKYIVDSLYLIHKSSLCVKVNMYALR